MSKQFPGAPIEGGFYPITFSQMGEKFNQGNTQSKRIGRMLTDLSIIMIKGPREYFDLYVGISKDYDKFHEFWNKEIFQKMGGKLGSKEFIAVDPTEKDSIGERIEGVDLELMTKLFGLMHFLIDPVEIKRMGKDNDPEYAEKCQILNVMLWTIYISIFKDEYLQKVASLLNNQRIMAEKSFKKISMN
jgi:hypothetical protein